MVGMVTGLRISFIAHAEVWSKVQNSGMTVGGRKTWKFGPGQIKSAYTFLMPAVI